MKINPPMPQPHHVARFKELIFDLQGVELTEEEALDQCIRLTHFIFLTEYALPALRAQKQRE